MKTSVIFFPFDLFGSAGAGAGADLLADELREVLADNRREKVATRARAYSDHLGLKQFSFDNLQEMHNWRRRGRDAIRKATGEGRNLLWIAGNHLGALPIYDELAERDDVLVVQFDAHLDIHQFSECTSELSHGNFLLHVEGKVPPIINVGHRELLLTSDAISEHFQRTFPATELAVDASGANKALRKTTQDAKSVWLDIDCDVFDPAFFPGVSNPVPFGLSPTQVLTAIDAVWSSKVAGVCISEFIPSRDQDDRSLALLVWLIEYLLLRWHEHS